jgi:hypothetical protein
MRNSGLTHAECALIQPSYACIEDYRHGRPWQDEIARLRAHFEHVEQTLQNESQRSLGEALIRQIDERLREDSTNLALDDGELKKALTSAEPNVRIAAAYALARLTPERASRESRIAALKPNLHDSDPAVRFWTAVALEKVEAASARGKMEVHQQTLPIFLDTFRGDDDKLRLAALNQLASIAPACIGTNKQLRIVPEVRRAIVDACRAQKEPIREFALQLMPTFRWQRTAYESQRMRRHYLAASYDLECLAAETLAMGREFTVQPPSVTALLRRRSFDDVRDSIIYTLPIATPTAVPSATTPKEASQLVDSLNRTVHSKWLSEGNPVFWKIESSEADQDGLYFAVTKWRTDRKDGPKMIYVVPRPSMLSSASAPPNYWFEPVHNLPGAAWPATPPAVIRPREGVRIALGDAARNGREAFTAACDIFACDMAYYAMLVIDRDVQESADEFNWSGRFALLRRYQSRFFEQGGGGMSVEGGGGWDFHHLTMTCSRHSGELTLSVKPIEFELAQAPAEISAPPWVTEELKLMGWKPLKSLDFFGQMLFPVEYQQAVESFTPDGWEGARQTLIPRWYQEKSLPHPYFVWGLLCDRAGKRAEAAQFIKEAAWECRRDPNALADAARWEVTAKLYEPARKHADAALALWPDFPKAKKVLTEIDARVKSNLEPALTP